MIGYVIVISMNTIPTINIIFTMFVMMMIINETELEL